MGVWQALRVVGLGIIGYMVPRILIGLGVPLDEWAATLAAGVGVVLEDRSDWVTYGGLAIAVLLILGELIFEPVEWLIARLRMKGKKRVRLCEAVIEAYEKTHGTLHESAAEALDYGRIEQYYAEALTYGGRDTGRPEVPVYGRKPPSRVHLRVPPKHVDEFIFVEKANVLVDQWDDNRRYVDLEIERRDLDRRIREFKEMSRVVEG